MAVTKLWPVKVNLKRVLDYASDPSKTISKASYSEEQYQALADVLAYAENEEKTEQELYVQGINCEARYAREQFLDTKLAFGKVDGIQAYHGYLSFKEQNITPALAQEVGMEFARRVWGERFQVVVTTHLNTQHLHCHFVINSVSFSDGKRLHGDEKAWIKFRYVADEICREYGLYYEPNPDSAKQNSYYYRKEKAGMPTRYSILREVLDELIEKSRSISEFRYNLEKEGYRYQLSANRKYWTVIPKGYDKPVRLYKLGENYTNEAIMKRLDENYHRLITQSFHPRKIVFRRYDVPKKGDNQRRIGGLHGLYLYYCYKLGYFSKDKRTSPAEIHHIFREDWLKIDEISAQTRLLGREQISTVEQLDLFRTVLDSEINTLIADRKLLRNRIRTKIEEIELSKAKEQIAAINERLKTLRKEKKLCEGIAERAEQIRVNLSIALADEEKTKEVRSDEQRR